MQQKHVPMTAEVAVKNRSVYKKISMTAEVAVKNRSVYKKNS